jgi:hypothetical protein
MTKLWTKTLVPTALLALALVACGGGTSTTQPTPSVTGVSVTLEPSEIEVGRSTTASAAVQGSDGVSQTVTWESSDTSVATVDAGGLVTGIGRGVADIIATSTADVTKSGSAPITVVDDVVTADCSTTTPLSGNIVTDTTLALDCYSVTGFVNIQDGATLTIAPGSVLRFAAGSGLRVEVDGALVASGTAINPIVLTSTASIAGSWLGVYIRSNEPTNAIRHVTIAYAGQKNFSFHSSNTIGAGLRVGANARATIGTSTFRGNDTTGIHLDADAVAPDFASNVFHGNAGTPMQLSSNQIGLLDDVSNYVGEGFAANTNNHIGVRASTVTTEQTWPAANVPYRLSGFTIVDGANASVNVSAGATFEGTSASGIRVQNDASFSAIGSPGNEIVFRGSSSIPGTWLGLYFNSNNPDNALQHVEVEAAGQLNFSFHSSNDVGGGVRIGGGARASISESTFRGNATTGIHLSNLATVAGFANNRFDGNQGTAMELASNQIGMLDAASDYAGAMSTANTDNHIGVRSSTVTTGQTWPAANVPYRLSGFTNIEGANAAVTIQPGAAFEGLSNSGIRVRQDGSLNAVGTADSRITFNGVSSIPGSWIGILIQTNSTDNVFDYVTIDAAGNPNFSFHNSNTSAGNLRVGTGARLGLTNTTLTSSETAGLRLESTSTLQPTDPESVAAGNQFSGNVVNIIDNR